METLIFIIVLQIRLFHLIREVNVHNSRHISDISAEISRQMFTIVGIFRIFRIFRPKLGVEIFHVSRFSQNLKFGDTYIHHSIANSIISFNSGG